MTVANRGGDAVVSQTYAYDSLAAPFGGMSPRFALASSLNAHQF